MFLLRETAQRKNSLPKIGRFMGRHHTAVTYGCDQIRLALASGQVVSDHIQQICERLRQPEIHKV
jgi:chromosomal replication initiation ATPase DnaA